MNNYLLTLVLKPEMDEKERKALLDSMVKKIIGEEGKIKKQTKGFFAHFEIEADPSLIKGIDKTLLVEEDILRHLLVRV